MFLPNTPEKAKGGKSSGYYKELGHPITQKKNFLRMAECGLIHEINCCDALSEVYPQTLLHIKVKKQSMKMYCCSQLTY
jgi:hypothetical protein